MSNCFLHLHVLNTEDDIESNTLVLGAKFETIDYRKIPEEMSFLDKEDKALIDEYENMTLSKYVERVIQIHHRMTVIHAFRDGNGRTTRAFANLLLLKRRVSPVFFKSILSSFAALSDFRMYFFVEYINIVQPASDEA